MTYEEIATMIGSINLPYAYYQFPEGTDTEPPFICFYYPSEEGFYADDTNYAHVVQLIIELYTRTKDFAAEAAVEAALNAHGIPYARYESYLDDEKLIMNTYESEVLING